MNYGPKRRNDDCHHGPHYEWYRSVSHVTDWRHASLHKMDVKAWLCPRVTKEGWWPHRSTVIVITYALFQPHSDRHYDINYRWLVPTVSWGTEDPSSLVCLAVVTRTSGAGCGGCHIDSIKPGERYTGTPGCCRTNVTKCNPFQCCPWHGHTTCGVSHQVLGNWESLGQWCPLASGTSTVLRLGNWVA